jgi:hypothetical protein
MRGVLKREPAQSDSGPNARLLIKTLTIRKRRELLKTQGGVYV